MSAQAMTDLILGITTLVPLTVYLVVLAVTWTVEDLVAWYEERETKRRRKRLSAEGEGRCQRAENLLCPTHSGCAEPCDATLAVGSM